jgi:hypothetical protein
MKKTCLLKKMVTACAALVTVAAFAGDGVKLMAGSALILSDNGQAKLPIVTSVEMSALEKAAVRDLVTYVNRVTGASFKQETTATWMGGPAIYVGNTPPVNALSGKLAPGEALLSISDNCLLLGGNGARGVSRAIYAFLQDEVGCRWYSYWDEVIPVRPTLRVPSLQRNIPVAFAMTEMNPGIGGICGKEMAADFLRRNQFMEAYIGVPPNASHMFNMRSYLDPAKYFDTHPEYCSFWNGARSIEGLAGGTFCLTNPEVRQLVGARMKEVANAHPHADAYTIMPGGRPHCLCEACLGFETREGSGSGQLLDFVNSLSDGLQEEHPGAQVWTIARLYSQKPPLQLRPRPQVGVLVSTSIDPYRLMEDAGRLSGMAEGLAAWRPVTQRLGVWENDADLDLLPGPSLEALASRIRFYHRLGVEYLSMYSRSTMRPMIGLRHWITYQLIQQPGRDLWTLVEDYCHGIFGDGAPWMFKYLRLLESRRDDFPYRLFEADFLLTAQRGFDLAEAATANQPAACARIREQHFFLDIATLKFWSLARADFARRGGNLKTGWTLDLATVLTRTEGYLGKFFAEQRWIVSPSERDRFQRQFVAPTLTEARAMRDCLSLPEELKGIDPSRIIELAPPIIGQGTWALAPDQRPVVDPDAAFGLAMRVDLDNAVTNKEWRYALGSFQYNPRQDIELGIPRDAIRGDGYNFYRLGDLTFDKAGTFYLNPNWRITLPHLESFIPAGETSQHFTVYVSLKAPADSKTGHIDRIILVKDGI